MPRDDVLEVLLDRWEEARDRGESVTPQEICREHPELIEELVRQIEVLSTIDAFLNGGAASAPTPARLPADDEGGAGRYHPLRFHAAGGLGEIFVARDAELGRDVALKRIQGHLSWSTESRRRFVLEAEVTGKLEHPGVVPVYGFGFDADDQPYYAMRFIRGETLGKAIEAFHQADRPGRDPGARALALQKLIRGFLAACQTIAYAHSRQVIHRDLKPANIMLGPYGETLVVDWGLAKPLGRRESPGPSSEEDPRPIAVNGHEQTTVGSVKGSPAYMSPEQAEGLWDVVGPASDIYSLGATLYTLLTGRRPFDGKTLVEVLERVKRGEFERPRQVKPAVPAALEAVCLKAMSRKPEDRYAGALDLAADLERWLSDEPVSAWREPFVLRARRWVRNHRTLVTASAATLVAGLALLSVAAALLEDRNRQLKGALGQAEASLYVRNVALADRVWSDGQVELAEQILDECPRAPRGWEWDYLKRRCHPELLTRTVASGPAEAVAFLPDSRRFATAGRNEVAVWEASTGRKLRAFQVPGEGIGRPAFCPDGRRLAGVAGPEGHVLVWESSTGEVLDTIAGTAGGVESLAFSGDGRRLALAIAAGGDGRGEGQGGPARGLIPRGGVEVIVRDVESRRQVGRFAVADSSRLGRMVFSADGRRLSIPELGVLGGSVTSYDVESGASVSRFGGIEDGRLGRALIALGPDARSLAVPDEGNAIRLRDPTTGAALAELRGHTDRLRELRYSTDGRYLASSGADRSVRIWDLRTSRSVSVLRGLRTEVDHLAISPDGRLAVLAGGDSVLVWEIAAGSASKVLAIPGSDPIAELAFDLEGRGFATVADGRVTLRDLATGEPRALAGQGGLCLAYRPHGRLLVAEGDPAHIRVVDGLGRTLGVLGRGFDRGTCLEFAPGGRRFATSGTDNLIRLHESVGGRVFQTLQGHTQGITALAFSPDGRTLASGAYDRTIVLWDVASGRLLKRLRGPTQPVKCLAFHPAGRFLVASGADDEGGFIKQVGQGKTPGELKVWDTSDGSLRFTFPGHAAGVSAAAWSPDGRRIVSADGDGVLKLWDASSGRELLTLHGPSSAVNAVTFSGDGRRIASAGGTSSLLRTRGLGEVALWDGRPLGSE